MIRRESTIYRKDSDLLGEFLDEKTQALPNERVDQAQLFGTWRDWCVANGVRYGSKKSFTRKLDERGFKEARSNGQRYYAGLSLNTQGLL
jgi:putative DNA primase/helicase